MLSSPEVPNDAAGGEECMLVGAMLRPRTFDVDRHPRDVGQLARRNRRTNRAGNRHEHLMIILTGRLECMRFECT